MKDMWNRIRRARLSAGLSQAALAKETGVRRSAVTQWEKEGGTSPSVANLARVAVVTQVHFEWLATGRGPGRPADGSDLPPPEGLLEAQRTPQECAILSLLRRLPHRKRQMAHTILEMLTD